MTTTTPPLRLIVADRPGTGSNMDTLKPTENNARSRSIFPPVPGGVSKYSNPVDIGECTSFVGLNPQGYVTDKNGKFGGPPVLGTPKYTCPNTGAVHLASCFGGQQAFAYSEAKYAGVPSVLVGQRVVPGCPLGWNPTSFFQPFGVLSGVFARLGEDQTHYRDKQATTILQDGQEVNNYYPHLPFFLEEGLNIMRLNGLGLPSEHVAPNSPPNGARVLSAGYADGAKLQLIMALLFPGLFHAYYVTHSSRTLKFWNTFSDAMKNDPALQALLTKRKEDPSPRNSKTDALIKTRSLAILDQVIDEPKNAFYITHLLERVASLLPWVVNCEPEKQDLLRPDMTVPFYDSTLGVFPEANNERCKVVVPSVPDMFREPLKNEDTRRILEDRSMDGHMGQLLKNLAGTDAFPPELRNKILNATDAVRARNFIIENRDQCQKLLFWVGRFDERKGPDHAVEITHRVPGATLIMSSPGGPAQDNLRDILRKPERQAEVERGSALENTIKFLKDHPETSVTSVDMPGNAVVAAFSYFIARMGGVQVQSNKAKEPFGLVGAQGRAAGLPMVEPKGLFGSQVALDPEGPTAYEPGNLDDAANKVRQLVEDEGHYQLMVTRGKTATTELTPSSCQKQRMQWALSFDPKMPEETYAFLERLLRPNGDWISGPEDPQIKLFRKAVKGYMRRALHFVRPDLFPEVRTTGEELVSAMRRIDGQRQQSKDPGTVD